MNSLSADLFFNPAASMSGAWFEQPRATSRKRSAALRRALLEQQEHKQETICSVILLLCMLFSIAVCMAQFAAS